MLLTKSFRRSKPVSSAPSAPAKRMVYMPGKMILKIKADAVRPSLGGAAVAMTAKSAALLPESVSAPLQYLKQNAGLKEVHALFSTNATALSRVKGTTAAVKNALGMISSVSHSLNEDLAGYNTVTVDPKRLDDKLIKMMSDSKGIEIAERMPARYISAAAADPKINLQWGLRAIGWFTAKRPAAGSITVAVLDTGIDETHADLKANIAAYNHSGVSATDIIGHGTHVSGTIAALINNGIGIAGVADCRLMVWKIFGDQPANDGNFYVDGETYLRALGEARNSGARVMNLSIGGPASSQTEQILFDRLRAAGVTVIAAMGNEFQEGNPTSFPAAYRGVIAVGAIGADLRRASFSNTGSHIAVCAPGVGILSTLPMKKVMPFRDENEYASWDGTSMATPHVSGAAALFCAKTPGALPADVLKALTTTCKRVPGMGSKKRTNEFGSGLIDLEKLLS